MACSDLHVYCFLVRCDKLPGQRKGTCCAGARHSRGVGGQQPNGLTPMSAGAGSGLLHATCSGLLPAQPAVPNSNVLAATTRSNRLSPDGLPSPSLGKAAAGAGSAALAGPVDSPAPSLSALCAAHAGHTPFPGKGLQAAAATGTSAAAGLDEVLEPVPKPQRPTPEPHLVTQAEQLLVSSHP